MRMLGRPDQHNHPYIPAPDGAGSLAAYLPRQGGASRRRRTVVLGALAAAAVALCCTLLAVPARASTYDASICGVGGAAGTSDGLTAVDNPGTYGYMNTLNLCSSGGPAIIQHAFLPSSSYSLWTWDGDGSWTLSAPANTTIQSLTMNRTFSGFQSWFTYELKNAAGTLVEGAATYNSYGVPANGTRTLPVNSTSLTGRFWCANADCTGTGTSVTLSGITATLNDNSSPTFNATPSGSLFDSGSISGTRGVLFDASDVGGGVYRVVLLVDGVQNQSIIPDSNGGRCQAPFQYLAPCKSRVTGTFWVDSTLMPEGQHQVQIAVYDATNANRVVSAPQTVTVDNIPAPSGGVPSLSGTMIDGQTLTANPGVWQGATGAYTYAYLRCDANGVNCATVSGATSSTYTLTQSDVGSTLRVRVTAANSAGETTQATSAATPVIQARLPVAIYVPAVSGTVLVGQALSSTTGRWTGTPTITYARQWERCDAFSICTPIAGATAATYTPSEGDAGQTIVLAVTATNAAGAVIASSVPTAIVPPVAPTSIAPPAISGTPRDRLTVTVDDGSFDAAPTPSISRVWERCDPSDTCVAIASATAATYTATAADIGSTLRVAVTATNAAGTLTVNSAETAPVAAMAPVALEQPAITGAWTEGIALAGHAGLWDGSPTITYAYAWSRCDDLGTTCQPLAAASDPSYVPVADDVDHRLRLTVTAGNAAGPVSATSTVTPLIQARPPSNEQPPTITGQSTDGQTLTASPGEWSGTPQIRTELSWLRCDAAGGECAAVATGSDYDLGPDDVGHTMRARASATNIADETSAISDPTALVQARAPDSVRAPQLQVAQDAVVALGPPPTVRSDATLSVADDLWDGTGSLETTIAWERCTTTASQTCERIPNANSRTYALDTTDAGTAVRAEVSVANNAGTAHAYTATVLVERPAPLPAPPAQAPSDGARAPSTQAPTRLVATQLRVGEPVTSCRVLLRRVLDAGLGALRAEGTLTHTTRVRAGRRTLLTIAVHGQTVLVEQGRRVLAKATGADGLRWTQRSSEQLVLQSTASRLLLAIGRNPHHQTLVVVKERLCTSATPDLRRLSALAGQQLHLALTLTTTTGQPLPHATVHLDDATETRATIGHDGVASVQLRAAGNRRVRVTFAGDSTHAPATLELPVDVGASTTLTLLSGSIPAHGPVELLGRLHGAGDATGTRIRLAYKAPGGRWRTVGIVRADADGRWHLTTSRPTTRPRQTLVLYQASIAPGPHYPYSPRTDAPVSFHLAVADRSKP